MLNETHKRSVTPIAGQRIITLALCALLMLSLPAIAQQGTSEEDDSAAPSDQPTLDELLELTPETTTDESTDGDTGDATTDGEAAESIERMLSGEEATDLFERVVQEMGDVSMRLGRDHDPGIETQRMQQSILDKLDQVIAAARRQQQQQQQSGGGGGGGQQQNQPRQQDQGGQNVAQQNGGQQGEQQGQSEQNAQGNQAHSGEASPGSTGSERAEGAMRELREEWGNLPPRLREEISEGMNERFSPVYRSLTEAYYQQLAEEE